MGFTLFVVDRLLHLSDEAKRRPMRIAAYLEVRRLASKYVSFWVEHYCLGVADSKPASLEQFLTVTTFKKIYLQLHLDAFAFVNPPVKLWDWIPRRFEEIISQGNKVLDRHMGNLDPDAYWLVHQLIDSSHLTIGSHMRSIRKYDIDKKFPRPENLMSYAALPDDGELELARRLCAWCETEREALFPNDTKHEFAVYYDARYRSPSTPKSAIPPALLAQQTLAVLDLWKKDVSPEDRQAILTDPYSALMGG